MSLQTELTTGPLAAELVPLIAAGDDGAIVAVLNRRDMVVPGNLRVHDVKQYISLIGLRLPLMDSTTPACREFNTALEDFKDSGFDLFTPMILGKITQVMDALIAETLIPDFTETTKLTLLSLGNKTISRAEQLGLSITEVDVRKELWNDDGTRKLT